MKGLYVQLRDARNGGYRVRVKAGRHVDGWFHVLTVDEQEVTLLGRTPVQVALEDISALVADEEDKRINRELDTRRGA